MDSKSIVTKVCGSFYVAGKKYHTPLPAELSDWYVYLSDGGHSIVCCLKSDFVSGKDLSEYLVPVPVKTVLRGYEIQGNYVVVDLHYSSDLGLIFPRNDEEF